MALQILPLRGGVLRNKEPEVILTHLIEAVLEDVEINDTMFAEWADGQTVFETYLPDFLVANHTEVIECLELWLEGAKMAEAHYLKEQD